MLFQRASQTARAAGLAAWQAEALSFVNSVYGTARRLADSDDEAADLTGAAYLQIFDDETGRARGAALKIALLERLCRLHRERGGRRAAHRAPVGKRRVPSAQWQAARLARDLDAGVLPMVSNPDLRDAMDSLPSELRSILWLRDVERLTYAQIAGVLALSATEVVARLSEARQSLFGALCDRLATLVRFVGDIPA